MTRTEYGLEDRLRDGLETSGQLVSISGPSKSGKTVFVENVVGPDRLQSAVTGAGIAHPSDLWDRILDWMSVPASEAKSSRSARTLGTAVEVEGEAGVPLIAKGKAGASGQLGHRSEAAEEESRGRRGMQQVIEEISDSDFVVLIDDFHYMTRDVQDEVAKQLKEAVRQGVSMITASVTHRSDDVVRANPELRGRVLAIDFAYWEPQYLQQIADIGFGLLNASVDSFAVSHLVKEASGSPQLMQAICLNACFEMDVRQKLDVPTSLAPGSDALEAIFKRTSTMTDFRSLVDALDTGPATRGTERKTYSFVDGTSGDVYRAILEAIAQDPPILSLAYEDLTARLGDICHGEAPVGSSVISSCQQMAKLAQRNFPLERPLDWDDERGGVLDLPDPYLLFYLRWSTRLLES
ncbi:MAG: hypothetical protein U5R14_03320 [Gemmatimonadota bacterium]|nr:hypothetical protein [Gemmatimonadota bacterium]